MKNSFTASQNLISGRSLPQVLRLSMALLCFLVVLASFVTSIHPLDVLETEPAKAPFTDKHEVIPTRLYSVGAATNLPTLPVKAGSFIQSANSPVTSLTVAWNKFFQGSEARAITAVVDGGYVAVGYTYSTLYNKESYNFLIVRVDEDGNVLWQKTLGGSSTEYVSAVVQSADGGFVVAGHTDSNDGDVSGNHGLADGWVVKLDKNGNVQWTKAIGGSSADFVTGLTPLSDGSVMGAGWGYSTDGNRSGGHGSSDFWVFRMDADGNVLWSKSFGGYDEDHADAITSLKYGQFAVFGYTYSNDGDVSGNHGSADYWVIKIDFDGHLIWQKTLGGSATDWGWGGITASADNELVMAGLTYSNDGDVSGSHSPTSTDLGGTMDYWVVKVDNDGNLVWQRALGGSADDRAEGILAVSDGGFIVAGQSNSNDGDVSGNHGNGDAWLIKLDPNGNLHWQKPLGGSGYDFAWAIAGLSTSSFAIAGSSGSTDGDINQTHSSGFWLAKLELPAPSQPLTLLAPTYNCQSGAFHFNTSGGDGSPIEFRAAPGITGWTTNPDQFVDKESRTANDVKPFTLEARQNGITVTYNWDLRAHCSSGTPPNMVWQRVYGGTNSEEGLAIAATSDGNFISAGRTMSNDGDITGYHGGPFFGDFWVVKVTPTGKLLWRKALGGNSDDYANAITATSDGGCIVAGYTDSNEGDASGNHGASDFWVVRLNSAGAIVWQKSFGGTRNDRAFSMAATADGGVVVAGFTNSSDEEVTNNHGYRDFWAVKISGSGDLIWQRTIGGPAGNMPSLLPRQPMGDT
ncbi:hypothetical protein [Spirosoma aureum]|uniref:hypothetical protein n=1 Tax=Spirosoma aureum TaxID=2692134 RepID=UPI001E43345B|nr:hypothetical protein [Spirosoma aureum]